ncbi:hypothetical protein D3C84_512840 [compost metagenome]
MGGRRPPAVVHQRGGGAQVLAGANRIAGVVGRRRTPVAARGLWMVLRAHVLVTLETACPQHHATTGLDQQSATAAGDLGAQHPAILLDQPLQAAVQPDRDFSIQQGTTQGGDQGIAQGEEAVALRAQAARQIAPIAPEYLQGQPEPAGTATEQHLGFLHGHGHAAHHQGAGGRFAHQRELFTELARIEG